MAMWAYKGVDPRGKSVTGVRDADSPKGLRALLRRDGILVTDVSEARTSAGGASKSSPTAGPKGLRREVDLKAIFQRVRVPEVAGFTRQLATLLRAGIPLAESLGKHGKVFEGVYVSMVRAGEAAGNLDQVLVRLADFLEAQVRLKSKVVG